MEFIAARKKLFATKRAEEQRNKPPTKAEQRKKLCTYMKHMAGYKDKDFKGKSFDAIKQMFDKAYKQVNDFVPMDTESSRKKVVSKKRAGESPSKESAKRQKIKDDAEKAELKAYLEIVPGDDSAVNIESLATKYPIVYWKTHILAEDKMYYQIIKSDGSTKYYKIFSAMLDDFDRQDVLDLYRGGFLGIKGFLTVTTAGSSYNCWLELLLLLKIEEKVLNTVFREPPYPFDYPMRRLTMKEILAKFIDEGRREHEEMKIFIKEFRTTNELLLKTRSNLLSELKIEVNELSKVMSNVLIPKNEVKGVTTMGKKMASEAACSKEINEQEVQEKPHNDGVENKSSGILEKTTQPLAKPQQSSIPFPNRVRKDKEEALQRNFLENLKQLDINISFIDALVQIPKYAKYLKSLLTNKSKLEEACTKTMNERCLAVLLNELPLKEKDPRSFAIPCQVLEKHKETEDLAAYHSSRLENPHMEVLTEREIANEFSDEHLMVLKSKSKDNEPWYADFVNYIVGKVVPPNWTFEKRKRFFSQVKAYFWEEPYAFKLCADNIMRRCVAEIKTLKILARCHSGPTGGHHSANVTAKKVYESGFYWPSVFKDANEYVCEVFDVRGLDFMGPFPESRGNKYILVTVDYVSKWVEAQVLPTNDARVVVKFLRQLFARFGVPKALISDRGKYFCNSQLEKALQRAIKRILERSVGYNPKGWSEKLNDALWAFRTAYKTPTGCTSFRLVYGKACHLPMEIEHKAHWPLKQCNMDLTLTSGSRLMQLNELAELRDGAYENNRIYKERTNKWHDSRLRGDKDFKVGDQVLLYNSRLKMYPGKLKSKWSGPNIVKMVYPHGAIEITDRDGLSFKIAKVQHERLLNFMQDLAEMNLTYWYTLKLPCVELSRAF
ncbi:reverse transcriptase domain-containing protein [Tanacetum coccineum]